MEIVVSKEAVKWFKDEVGLEAGNKVKFYPMIYGSSPIQENYALGFTIDNEPVDMLVQTEKEGLTFYVEGSDIWYFKDYNLHVGYNEKKDELEYNYEK